jgi:ATP-binding cassette subfamily B protein RaxB
MAVRTDHGGGKSMTTGLDLGLLRRRRVHLVRQTEVAECGLASLAMVANYHGYDTDLGALRRRFVPSLRGVTLKSLMGIADELDLSTRAVKLPLERLGDLYMPAVLHWNMTHYVVLEAVRGNRALIHNPEGQSSWMPLDQVSDHFTGIALELRPTESFGSVQERSRLRLNQLWSRITGLKRALVQTLILSLVMQCFVLALPYYMQVALDSALPALDVNLLTVLALGFGLFTLFNAVASLLRGFVLLSAGTALGFGIASNIARRLFRLPVGWFERRHVGDVLSRFQSITPIRLFLTEGAVAAVLDGSLTVLTLAVMAFYSPILTAVALLAFALYAAVRAISFMAQRDAQEEAIVMAGREQTTMIESVRGIVTLRLFNREAARHALWQSKLTDSMNANVSLARIGLWQATASTLILGIEMIVSIWLSVRLMISGGFSTGMVFAYLSYKTQFLQKAASFIDQAIIFRMLGLHLERLSDIALAEQDPSFQQRVGRAPALKGRLELRNVGFRYSPTDPFVLRGVDLVVEPGEHIAITGPSGGGKSTLVKIILGLVEPDEGEVLVDGVSLAQFGYKHYHDQIGAVLQDDHLFAGSLADNIALFDDTADMARVVESATTAALHGDIEAMPMGYETLVGDMGSTLSGGQKQRLLLARALYRRPRMLIMDEATSHLDACREREVIAAVANLGITRIVIAHRRETIMAATRILAAQDGKVTDVSEHYRTGETESRQRDL